MKLEVVGDAAEPLMTCSLMTRTLIICFLLLFALPGNHVGVAFQPEFAEPILNLTVPLGRDATFTCVVRHLGGYRVGWVKADTKAIQAIHDHVITHNPRVAVSHNDYSTWNLHIRGVQEEDRGSYMCQINTDPMQSQMGHLDVVVPPDIVNEDTSGDVMVPEGGTVKLTCRARGYPTPHVQWRREDNSEIVIREPSGVKTKVSNFQGEFLKLSKVTRSEMGAYLCIASNGIPPSVSKRIMVNVHFHPVIQVPNQLVGAPLGTDVTLECQVEASPRSINYWVRDTEIPGPTRKPTPGRYVPPHYDEEDYPDQLGSAEQEAEEEMTNNVADRVPTKGGPHPTLLPPGRKNNHVVFSERGEMEISESSARMEVASLLGTVAALLLLLKV
ncbi:lachesin-like isoform X4 [Neocloeon triangulifer]|uniref:lachesin-like isoform X4 n=1 Tax=Neocloeon triangulifer TaxID=2078957 RepID=UPI00286F300A|nr:lachesin-like isoform X4 [Neocloeon triangulifer]